MDSSTPASNEHSHSRLWLWLKRSFLVMLGLIVLAVAFHRPLLRWTLEKGGAWVAKSAGYDLRWKVHGDILSTLRLQDVHVRGPEPGVLKSVDVREATARYDLWALARKGLGQFLRDVSVSDATIELDLRAPSPPAVNKESKPLPEIWADRLNLQNINLRASTVTGDIALRGFSLLLDETQAGDLAIAELDVPSAKLHLLNAHGKTAVANKTVTLTDLVIMPEFQVPKLRVDLAALQDSKLPFELQLHSGPATLEASGVYQDWATKPSLDGMVVINRLSQAEIARWIQLPEDLAWRVDQARLRVHGNPAQPRTLSAVLMLDASALEAGGVHGDHIKARASMHEGKLQLESLALQAGTNAVDLAASATLPASWGEMAQLSTELRWSIDGPDLAEVLREKADVSGSLRGSGTVALTAGRLTKAEGVLHGSQLRYGKWMLETLQADLSSDASGMQIKAITARLDEHNSATFTGSIQWENRQTAELSGDVVLGDLSAAAKATGWQAEGPLHADTCTAEGTVRFTLADLREKNFSAITGQISTQVKNFVWQKRRVQHASLDLSLRDSKAVLQALDLQFDPRNNAQLSGSLSLLDRQPASLAWKVNIESLADLAPWFAGLPNAPLPQAGTFTSQGKGSGDLADLKQQIYTHATAEGTVNAAGIVAKNAHCDSVKIAFSCRDGRVDLNPFEIRLDERNQLTAHGNAMLDKPGDFEFELKAGFEQLESLSDLATLANASALKSGRAVISWKATGKISTGEMNGGGSVEVSNVQFKNRPEILALALDVQQQGHQAQITRLQASAGTFHAEAEATLSDTQVDIPRLTVFAGKLKLVDATVQMPLSLKDTSRPVNVSIQLVKMDFTKLFAALHIKAPVTGVANGTVELHGPPSNLDGSVALALTGVQASATKGKLPPAALRLNATLKKQHLSLDATADQKPLQPLRATGGFAFDVDKLINNRSAFLESAVDVHVTLPQSNLEIVRALTPGLEELQGTVGMDVRISGPLRSPKWEGMLLAAAPRATFEKTPMDIKDMKARVSFAGKHIVLEDVSAILAGGQLRAGGSVDVADLTNPRVDIHLEAQQALLVRDDTMSARADGRVTCRGSLTKAEVTGQVQLVRCRVFKEIEFLPLSLPNQLPPPPPAVRTAKPPSLPPPLDQWALNVDIVTRDPVRLLGNVFNGSATGALRLTGTGAKPQLVGEVSFEGAKVRLPNSSLSIKRGKLFFTKEKPFEPLLAVQGDSRVSNYDVTVYADGSALKPKVRFTSSPPLSEPEIAMLLATGSAAGAGSTADAAANQAAIMLLSKAYRAVFHKTTPKRYDEEPPRLTFKFSPLSTGTTQPGVSANYEISPKVQASGTVTERGTFRGMLYYMVRLR